MTKRYKFKIQKASSAELKEGLWPIFAEEAHCVLLDSHECQGSDYGWLAAWRAHRSFRAEEDALNQLYAFWMDKPDWCFGHLNFGLGEQTEAVSQKHPRHFEWPMIGFFVPETVLYARGNGLFCESYLYRDEEELLANWAPASEQQNTLELPAFEAQISEEEYHRAVESLIKELRFGNIYELNFCMEWQAKGKWTPQQSYRVLSQGHRAPFSAYYRQGPRDLLCFSPERYLQKRGDRVISQPIKGTAARGRSAIEDQQNREALRLSEKEQAENVMIVDLVRNDLSRTAAPGSVKVDELFGIYSFPAVHQMISTISSRLSFAYHWGDLLATTFPMGSMTGAPKHRALQLIESHENFHRELYSGSVGYIDPAGNMDFNVVIRSIMHHREKALSSVRVGSAITIHCDPQMEYEECLLKAEKLLR